ncbi:hypothetical protein MTR_6g046055 [Medicago truncatula]|uniref:Uncharacterized protein n=1 Tax=Medicago truncatula TaxID=3880 RepID=A0A072U9S4_MEDTR|nr:hypothetical protein MTR_6g046055 [Medicago truncatula]
MGSKWDIEKFTGLNDFGLWKVKMQAVWIQQKCEKALKGEESKPSLEPCESTDFCVFRKPGRSNVHRSPRRAMILASRVMKFIARHASLFPSPRELFGATRHGEQPFLASRA